MMFDERSEHALSGAVEALQALADRPGVDARVRQLFTTEAVFFDTLLLDSLADKTKDPPHKDARITRPIGLLLEVGATVEMNLDEIEAGKRDRVGENVRRLFIWINSLINNYLLREYGWEVGVRLRMLGPAVKDVRQKEEERRSRRTRRAEKGADPGGG